MSNPKNQPPRTSHSRRQFLQSAAVGATGITILPSGLLGGPTAPSNKLNIALIGTWGRGLAHFGAVKGENVVALCDINEEHLNSAGEKFPNAKRYVDWRKCLDQDGLDAIVCSTTDFTHAHISNWALNRGLHVYCEKPLGNSVEEARVVRANYLRHKDKLATQVGTQRHSNPNFDRVREAIRDSAVGTLQHVHVWGNRQLRRDGYFPAEGTPPAHLHYDLWLGPVPHHPYNPEYFSRGPGANCLSWNMFWDFGSGQIGDMGSHTMDLAWNAIGAGLPTSIEAHGEAYNPDVTPVDLTATFEHTANDWRPAIKVTWYQGAHKPNEVAGTDVSKIGHGALFEGDKGSLTADFGRHHLHAVPGSDLSHYTPRAKEEQIAPMGGFQQQWIKACKTDLKTSCDMDYSGTAIEQMLLGLVAYRAGARIDYDGETGEVTNNDKANALLSKQYRAGWPLDG
ncbi:MAG: Gfo/Idh/MocA family protein [Aeoliella sp.]